MKDLSQQLAKEIETATKTLNEKLAEAENSGLAVIAEVYSFPCLDHPRSDKRTRIEATILQPILPEGDN